MLQLLGCQKSLLEMVRCRDREEKPGANRGDMQQKKEREKQERFKQRERRMLRWAEGGRIKTDRDGERMCEEVCV